MTIANMTTEWGALAGVFSFDEVTVNLFALTRWRVREPERPGKRGPKSRRLQPRLHRRLVEESK